MAASLELSVQYAAGRRGQPAVRSIRRWVQASFAAERRAAALTGRIVEGREGRRLRRRWRGIDKATNVLAFPMAGLEALAPELLGDLVICAPVVEREAAAQGKTARAHFAHMVVHGVLHLMGYEHDEPRARAEMEAREVQVLAELGYADPYRLPGR